MSEVGTRPRWRDVLVVFALGVVIVGGVVHYGRGLAGEDDPAAHNAVQGRAASRSPTAQETAELDGAPPAEPVDPAAPTRTCWDGRETTSLRLCGLPEGARGLAWVFPSFARDRAQCHKASPNSDSYPVVDSYECFQTALGQPVTITYDQVEDPVQVQRWLLARLGPARMHEIPSAQGSRYIFSDGVSRPARITGMYERFPYAVSVYADSPEAAVRAWRLLVEQRAPGKIRGVRTG